MSELVHHLVKGLVAHPEAIDISVTEAEASLLIELRVHPDDVERIHGHDGQTLRALRQVLSASSGQRRAVLELANETDARHAAPVDSEPADSEPADSQPAGTEDTGDSPTAP
jgi:predicted RNA-binding protein YlqC (UPF0109 family)